MGLLDISTERGRRTLEDERLVAILYERHHPGWRYLHTRKEKPAPVDALILDEQWEIRHITETKCRYDMDLAKFRSSYNSQWLVTYQKIKEGCDAARLLCAPLIGLLFIVGEGIVLEKQLSDEKGNLVAQLDVRRTVTQATCNGGTALRDNAYIDMRGARELF